MEKYKDILWIFAVGAFCVLFPFILNWIILKEKVIPVVGDGCFVIYKDYELHGLTRKE